MLLPILLGVLVAGCKNVDRSESAGSGPTTSRSEHGSHMAPPQVRVSQVERSGPGPEVGDKWTAWVAINVCGQFLEPPEGVAVRGVTGHADGTVSIEPTTEDEAGHDATLAAYVESIGVELSTGALTFPETTKPAEIEFREEKLPVAGHTFTNQDQCGDIKGKVVAWVYSPDAVNTGNGLVTVAENPQDVPFFADGMAVVVSFTPESSLPTLPPSALLAQPRASGN